MVAGASSLRFYSSHTEIIPQSVSIEYLTIVVSGSRDLLIRLPSNMERTQKKHVFPRRHGQSAFLPQVVTLFTISSSISLFLFSSSSSSSTSRSFTFSLVDLRFHRLLGYYHQVITSHSFLNPPFCQDGSLDSFQVAFGHVHHSGDHGCCFGWYVS